MNNQDIREPTNCSKTDQIDWQACISVRIDDSETDFEDLGPASQNQILFDISNGYHSGSTWLRHEGSVEWCIIFEIRVNGIEIPFEALTFEEQEEIRWEIALEEIWSGSFECAKPIWGEAAAYGS